LAGDVAIYDMNARVTAVLIAYDGPPETLTRAIDSLREQSVAPAQIICVDQSPDRRFASCLGAERSVELLVSSGNLGYPSACNWAARRAEGDYLMFMNPDALAEPSCLEELVRASEDRPDVAIAGAQILLPDKQTVNAGDNTLHLSGLSWAGRYGLPAEDGPPRPAAVVSGAALLVRRTAFTELGGYTEGFFMYYDDVDLAWRARLRGWEVLFCPAARVVHDYEFIKGGYKWRYLERNRWWCMLAHLQLRTLLALFPLLVAVECAILGRAAREGWLSPKLAAWHSLWQDRRLLRARRAEVQRTRTIGDRPIVQRMRATVDSPFLNSAMNRHLRPLLSVYRLLVLALAPRR
jgi:GT2 family glycosyltransferase